MGTTGVGKSTWINAFANYFKYPTLEEAKASPKVCLIPTSFQLTDKNFETYQICTGKDKNEKHESGQSATRYPKTYVFRSEDFTLNLIDTPGIGDTDGVDQDEKNFQYILDHIANVEELHGICILLKSNEARLTAMFEYCITKLLTYLHKDACKNIVFCFTHCRSTNYLPGDTKSSLATLLEKKAVDIKLNRETVYCIDNEAVRYLAAVKQGQGILFGESEEKAVAESWNLAVNEFDRLKEHFTLFQPHPVLNSLSINDARNTILVVMKPLAEITKFIQETLISIVNQENDLSATKDANDTLKEIHKVQQKIKKTVSLKWPQIVCTAEKCKRRDFDESAGETEFCCSKDCKPLHKLKLFGKSKLCKTCRCPKNTHERIAYKIVDTEISPADDTVEMQVIINECDINAKHDHLQELKLQKTELEDEQKQIINTTANFACFLDRYAITPYYDGMDKYLDYFIHNNSNTETTESLDKIRQRYHEEVDILKKNISENKAKSYLELLSPVDIKTRMQSLYKMKHYGNIIKDCVSAAKSADDYEMKQCKVEGGQRVQKFSEK